MQHVGAGQDIPHAVRRHRQLSGKEGANDGLQRYATDVFQLDAAVCARELWTPKLGFEEGTLLCQDKSARVFGL